MNDAVGATDPPFHLLLADDEVRVATTALRLLIADEDHDAPVHSYVRGVLTGLAAPPDESGLVTVALTPQQMKITHTAVKLHFDDSRREQAEEREVMRRILGKLPDEHTMRAIQLD
jgi:hypothetical protein